MEYRELGRSGLKVSIICLGSMTWGEQNSEREAHAQLDRALERGVNFIDTAELYAIPPRAETHGATERHIGSWLAARGRRDQLIIASKVAGPGAFVAHIRGGPRLDRSHIRRAVEASLRRLQTDYIDLYQVHWPQRKTNFFGQLGYRIEETPDPITIEETLTALAELVREGKVRHIGLSNETPWGVAEYLRLAGADSALPRVVSIQNPYNLLNRSFEVGLAEFAHHEAVGLLAYSPLAFGVLSGKYLDGARPAGARLTLYPHYARYTTPRGLAATRAYVEVARRHGLAPAVMALAYINSRPFLTSNIIGATTLKQLDENIDSAERRLSDELLEEIEAIHNENPNPCP